LFSDVAFCVCKMRPWLELAYCAYEGMSAWLYKLDDFTTAEQRLYSRVVHSTPGGVRL
jgi:hypothetical protein